MKCILGFVWWVFLEVKLECILYKVILCSVVTTEMCGKYNLVKMSLICSVIELNRIYR